MTRIIGSDRSVIVACDTGWNLFERMLRATSTVEGVGGYKIGFHLALLHGLPAVTDLARSLAPGKALIYDHQKAGRDVPDTGVHFARTMRSAGVDAAIIYPDPLDRDTGTVWLEELLLVGVPTIVGAWMTAPRYAASEGGSRPDDAILAVYRDAVRRGVSDLVVPGNKPDAVRRIIRETSDSAVLYAPGIGVQGGSIAGLRAIVHGPLHPIIGRGMHERLDPREALLAYVRELR